MNMIEQIIRGRIRANVIGVIAGLIGLPLIVGFVALPIYMHSTGRIPTWMLYGSLGGFGTLLLGGGTGLLFLTRFKRGNKLDDIFTPLGLRASAYMNHRQYHGTINGRQVSVFIRQGPVLDIEVVTHLGTRMGITSNPDARMLASLFNKKPIQVNREEYQGLTVFGIDENWTYLAAGDYSASNLVQSLLRADGVFANKQIVMRPGRLCLTVYGSTQLFATGLNANLGQRLVTEMVALTETLERLPPPSILDQETSLEKTGRQVRARNPYLIPAVVGGGLLIFFCCVGVAATAFAFWASSQP